jgi:hypothetical protein
MANREPMLLLFPDTLRPEESIWLWLIADCLIDRTITTYAWPWENCRFKWGDFIGGGSCPGHRRYTSVDEMGPPDSAMINYHRLVLDGRTLNRQARGKVHRS